MNSRFTFIGFWVLWCALSGAAGWILSALHQLNQFGYAVFFLIAMAAAVIWWRRAPVARRPRLKFRSIYRRWRRPLPGAFLLLTVLILLSGLVHPPNNYDGLTYRIPRMLHWLAEGSWHWIESVSWRLNNRGCGFEWVAMPWLVFTGTDRGIFVLNIVSFLLLPGLTFSVFTRLGVRPRVAWWWMWLLPSGYCYLLQAGGGANDLFSAPLVLAAIDFALRLRCSGRRTDLWLSILAAGLMTAVKTTNLTLLLPWAVALLPSWRVMWSNRTATLCVVLAAALVSFAPTAILNQIHCGDWTGAKVETTPSPSMAGGIAGNTYLLITQNFVPPFFPWASWWNEHALEFLPGWLGAVLNTQFDPQAWTLREIQMEEGAGLGMGLALLLATGMIWMLLGKGMAQKQAPARLRGRASAALPVVIAPWISLLVYMAKVGMFAASRILTPYFALLLPLWLRSPQLAQLVRRPWWKRASLVVMGLAVFALVVNLSRPLWPAEQVLAHLFKDEQKHPLVRRARVAYEVYSQRYDALAPLRDVLPAEARVIGFLTTGDDLETSLWRPFGSRRVLQVDARYTAASLRSRHIDYVIINPLALKLYFNMDLKEWLKNYDADLVKEVTMQIRASTPPLPWYVARLRGPLAKADAVTSALTNNPASPHEPRQNTPP